MSGRKQHYIPQMLLKGFSSAGVGKKRKVYVYQNGKTPFSVPTDGIAAQREFYSPHTTLKGGSLDDVITDYEQKTLGPALSTMHSAPNGSMIDRDIVSEAINHLTIRNAQVRSIVSDAMTRTLSNFLDGMSTSSQAQRLLGLAGPEIGSHIRKALEEFWKENERELRQKGFKEDGFVEFSAELAKAAFPEMYPGLIAAMSPPLGTLISNIPKVTATSHRKAMTQDVALPIRTSKLAEFDWCVYDTPNLILSDCIAIAEIGNDWQPLTLVGTDGVDNIFAPISSNRAVIGFRNFPSSPLNPRRALARSASEFFVAPGRSCELEALSSVIGSVTNDAIDKISTFSL